nr:MAG TPA: hypothetical protein [Caudoviricetes sp.]
MFSYNHLLFFYILFIFNNLTIMGDNTIWDYIILFYSFG